MVENLTKSSSDVLQYELSNGKHRNLFRSWQRIDLTFRSYEIIEAVRQFKVDTFTDFGSADETVNDSNTEDGPRHNKHLKQLNLEERKEDTWINAVAEIDNASIFLVKLAEGDHQQEQKQFGDITISIQLADKDHTGIIWGELDDSPGFPTGLRIELHLSSRRMDAITKQLRALRPNDKVAISGKALLFENEVDSALKEPHHTSKYVLLNTSSFALETIIFKHNQTLSTSEDSYDAVSDTEGRTESCYNNIWNANTFLAIAVWALTAVLIISKIF